MFINLPNLYTYFINISFVGVFIPAAALVALVFIGNDQKALTVVMLVVAAGFNSAILCGFHVNHIDIAPRHAGTLMGITNAFGNVAAILAPLAVDVIKSAGDYKEVSLLIFKIFTRWLPMIVKKANCMD